MAIAKVARTKVFISYSHKDTKWLERLQVHLKPLERKGVLERWDDTQIVPGKKWQEEIRNALASAKIAVLLISADFLASDFIAEDEWPPLLAAAEQDGAVILPVIVSPSRFTKTPSLAQFQAVNPPDKPLIKLPKAQQEACLVQITAAIEDALNLSPSPSLATMPPLDKATEDAGQTAEASVAQSPRAPRPSPSAPPAPRTRERPTQHRWLGTWVFGSLLLAFLMGVFFFMPDTLPDFKHRLLAVCAALLAGFFGYFLSGEIGVDMKSQKSRFGDMAIRASGGMALFALVMIWWLSPLAPIEQSDTPPKTSDKTVLAQTLAGDIRDAAGNPLAGVEVSIPAYDQVVNSNTQGRFSLRVEAPYQASVELMARKAGYRTHEQYATLSNTQLGFVLQRIAP